MADVIANGVADFGVVFDQRVVASENRFPGDCACIPLTGEAEQARFVWLHESHPANKLATIRMQDLDGSKVLIPADLRYEAYEQFIRQMERVCGMRFTIVHGAGSRYDSALGIAPDEIEFLSSGDIDQPVYTSVPHRTFRRVQAPEESFQPCFVYRKSNDNPAVQLFALFMAQRAAAER